MNSKNIIILTIGTLLGSAVIYIGFWYLQKSFHEQINTQSLRQEKIAAEYQKQIQNLHEQLNQKLEDTAQNQALQLGNTMKAMEKNLQEQIDHSNKNLKQDIAESKESVSQKFSKQLEETNKQIKENSDANAKQILFSNKDATQNLQKELKSVLSEATHMVNNEQQKLFTKMNTIEDQVKTQFYMTNQLSVALEAFQNDKIKNLQALSKQQEIISNKIKVLENNLTDSKEKMQGLFKALNGFKDVSDRQNKSIVFTQSEFAKTIKTLQDQMALHQEQIKMIHDTQEVRRKKEEKNLALERQKEINYFYEVFDKSSEWPQDFESLKKLTDCYGILYQSSLEWADQKMIQRQEDIYWGLVSLAILLESQNSRDETKKQALNNIQLSLKNKPKHVAFTKLIAALNNEQNILAADLQVLQNDIIIKQAKQALNDNSDLLEHLAKLKKLPAQDDVKSLINAIQDKIDLNNIYQKITKEYQTALTKNYKEKLKMLEACYLDLQDLMEIMTVREIRDSILEQELIELEDRLKETVKEQAQLLIE